MSASAERIEEKAHELKLEYERAWRKQNREKIKAYNRNKWINKAKLILEAQGE